MSLNTDRIMTPNLPDIFPVLHSDRLDFTQMRAMHASDILYIYGEKKLAEYENIKILINEQEALEFIDRFQTRFNEKKGIRWAISIKGEKQVIGTIGFKGYIPLHKALVGYEIHPDFAGKGYATEALATALEYAFDSLDLKRVEAEVMPGNLASEKVLEKNGFKREGLLKRSMYWDGKYFDINLFALLQSDYHNR